MKNKSRKTKSPKDIQDQSLDKRITTEKKIEKKKEERVVDETRRESIEENVLPTDKTMATSQQQQPKLTKSSISLSQPHLVSFIQLIICSHLLPVCMATYSIAPNESVHSHI